MKKFYLFFLSLFLINEAFSQSGEIISTGTETIRYENRKKSGYFNITQIGVIMGNKPSSEQNSEIFNDNAEFQISPSLTMTHGGMINQHLGIGVGTGFEIFDRNLFPLFGDIRCFVRDDDIAPFFALKMGYAISGFKKKYNESLNLNQPPWWINNADFKKYGGFMFNPEMGIKFPLSEKADLMITTAYRYQKYKSIVYQGRTQWEQKTSLNRLTFGLAVMFR